MKRETELRNQTSIVELDIQNHRYISVALSMRMRCMR